MKALLDTCTFLWATLDDPKLSACARDVLRDPTNEIYLSAVSAWEMAAKYRAGRLPLPEPPHRFVPKYRELLRVRPLDLAEGAALRASQLPDIHRDPFDRMLVCQALVHGLTLLTPDPSIARYPVLVCW
ncbi:MAG: type II toxin-antitoxin system VapC family toxin [Deltaproteobacteria bacterium]|nr:type II toxin-antitoxin system VapC family toxin [Deltaproteobacteria bacterium]